MFLTDTGENYHCIPGSSCTLASLGLNPLSSALSLSVSSEIKQKVQYKTVFEDLVFEDLAT